MTNGEKLTQILTDRRVLDAVAHTEGAQHAIQTIALGGVDEHFAGFMIAAAAFVVDPESVAAMLEHFSNVIADALESVEGVA